MRDYKLVVLGAGGVGKSCLTVQFVQGVYLDTYDPTIEDSYRKTIEIDNKLFDLEILDTAGVAQFTAMRELYIKSGMGFLLVYSVTDRNSLNELLELREQVLKIKDSNRVPMVLVGNKADLKNERVISVEDGIEVSSRWGKVPFYETSALLRSNVDEVFIDLVRQIIRDEIENVINSNQNGGNNANRRNQSNGGQKMNKSQSELSRVSTPINGNSSRMGSRGNIEVSQQGSSAVDAFEKINSRKQPLRKKPSAINASVSNINKDNNVVTNNSNSQNGIQNSGNKNQNTSVGDNSKINKNIQNASTNNKNKKKKKKSNCSIL